MKKTTFVINSFQTPNAIIDKLMALLTDSELRVLMYATRHILGWQHKAELKQAIISLSNFQNGFKYTTDDNEVFEYSGTGLGRGTILKALEGLVEYRILAKVGEPSAIGQKWKLRFMVQDDVDIEGLASRQNGIKDKRKNQTDKARRSVQQTTNSQSVEQTDVVSSTDQSGLSNRHNERPSKDHSKDQPLSAPESAQGETTSEMKKDSLQDKSDKQEQPKLTSDEYAKFIDALHIHFKLNGGRRGDIYHQLRGSIAAKKKKTARYIYGQLFRDAPVTLDELLRFVIYYKRECEGCAFPISADGLEDWFGKYRQSKIEQANRPPTLFQQKLPTNYATLDRG